MPQPPLDLQKYLSTPLPAVRESYPPGTGGTGPRQDWNEGTLKGVHVIEDFKDLVKAYTEKLPVEPITPHPAHKYPTFVKTINDLPPVIKAPSDLMQYLKQIPLLAIATSLTALVADENNVPLGAKGAKALDQAGYESDGGEEPGISGAPRYSAAASSLMKTKEYEWKFSKSPLGSGEFLLQEKGSDKCKIVVRTINSSAFAGADWDEFVVTGPYSYNTKNKASWYWSRAWGSTKRLETEYFVLTDYNKWVFGSFADNHTHGCISPVLKFDSTDPTILQALMYWTRSALGAQGAFNPTVKDVSDLPPLFPANPARRLSVTRKSKNPNSGIKKANESDIEESDVEAHDDA